MGALKRRGSADFYMYCQLVCPRQRTRKNIRRLLAGAKNFCLRGRGQDRGFKVLLLGPSQMHHAKRVRVEWLQTPIALQPKGSQPKAVMAHGPIQLYGLALEVEWSEIAPHSFYMPYMTMHASGREPSSNAIQ